MKPNWSIQVARAVFFALSVFIGIAIALGFQQPAWVGAVSGTAFTVIVLTLDLVMARFSLRDFSYATFGLLIGLFSAWLITRISVFQLSFFQSMPDGEAVRNVVKICVYATLAFFGVTFALRSDRDQFAFLIPYVRFRRDASEGEPLLLDTNVIIDGRIPRVFATGFLSGTLVVPRFVLDELQQLADSGDALKAERGRRGLAVMEEMRKLKELDVTIQEDPRGSGPVDSRLVNLARELSARLLTNNENLAKVARLRGVSVLSFNELALALHPELIPGDELTLTLIKPGKERHQAVGYLPNGTMIVVNHASEHIGQTRDVVISGALATSAGRLVFAELKKAAA